MIQQMAWVTRTFDHHWPVGLVPSIVERLRGTPVRAAALARECGDAALRRGGDRWSALEHIGHLDDLHDLDMRRLEEYLARVPVLSAADMTNRATYEARHNERSTADVLERFRTRRQELIARLERLTPEEAAISAQHPRLHRALRLVDWLYFVAEHDDHHLTKAREAVTAGSDSRMR